MINIGDHFMVMMDGEKTTVCVIGAYEEDFTGEDMMILAIVGPEQLVHVPRRQIETIMPKLQMLH